MRLNRQLVSAAALLAFAACSNTNNVAPINNPNLFLFHTITTIGSILDPINGDQNPYGLAIAPLSGGLLTAGDLVVCDFNDAANVQGNGTSVEVIHPALGSTAHRFAQSASQMGCGAVAALSNGSVAVTAKLANNVLLYNSAGVPTLIPHAWNGPWGIAFAAAATPALYVSNANDGSIVRVRLNSNGTFGFDQIATGFSVNHGAPGNIFAPYGLSYSPALDALYIMDTNANRIVVFGQVSSIPANGIAVTGGTFSGPSAGSAHVFFSGPPLNNPLGSTLLPNGDVGVVNNSDDQFMEFKSDGTLVGMLALEPGQGGGALFSIAATVNTSGQTIVYYVDSTDNTARILSP